MLVREGPQILDDDEQVKQLLVDDLENRAAACPWDRRSENVRSTGVPAFGRAALGRDVHRILVRIGNPCDYFMPQRGAFCPALSSGCSGSIGHTNSTSGSVAAACTTGGPGMYQKAAGCSRTATGDKRIRENRNTAGLFFIIAHAIINNDAAFSDCGDLPATAVGQEVTPEAISRARFAATKADAAFDYTHYDWGRRTLLAPRAHDARRRVDRLREADAILLGAVAKIRYSRSHHASTVCCCHPAGLSISTRNVRPAVLYPGVEGPLASGGH